MNNSNNNNNSDHKPASFRFPLSGWRLRALMHMYCFPRLRHRLGLNSPTGEELQPNKPAASGTLSALQPQPVPLQRTSHKNLDPAASTASPRHWCQILPWLSPWTVIGRVIRYIRYGCL